jgi:phosphomannomutase
VGRLPGYEMLKSKFENVDWAGSKEAIKNAFPDAEADATDGWRFQWKDSWIHARPSGTEPVVRVIAEAPTKEQAQALCERARAVLRSRSSSSEREGAKKDADRR